MSHLSEVSDAISILEKAGTARESITVLHCNTEYPTPFADVNLRARATIEKDLGIGYSWDTPGIEVYKLPHPAALGAHVT
jgi:N,N'-diacetyllegionaminate synthase